MKLFTLLCVLGFSFSAAYGQDIGALLKEGDRLEAVPDERAAFLKFKDAVRLQPSNLHALTKCSELAARIGGREKKNKVLRNQYYETAVNYAKTALRYHPESDVANVAMAIAVGKTILLKSGREKISAAKQLKDYGEKALAVNPNNFKAWHILGRWNYEVSNLSSLERAGARIIYGGLPTASLKTAIKCYEKAKSLSPAFAYNYLELAKAYKRNNEREKAMAQLRTMITLRNQSEDDPRIKKEAEHLLAVW